MLDRKSLRCYRGRWWFNKWCFPLNKYVSTKPSNTSVFTDQESYYRVWRCNRVALSVPIWRELHLHYVLKQCNNVLQQLQPNKIFCAVPQSFHLVYFKKNLFFNVINQVWGISEFLPITFPPYPLFHWMDQRYEKERRTKVFRLGKEKQKG